MIEITVDMEAIIKQAILSFVATVNEDGTPNLSPKASLTVTNGVLYFADIASPRTILNLRRNPAVEINVIDIFQRRGYRFKGRALILSPGDDEYLMIADWVRATNGLEYPVDHVVKIETTSIIPLRSPAHVFANPPRSQDEIRSTYYQKYGVKPIMTKTTAANAKEAAYHGVPAEDDYGYAQAINIGNMIYVSGQLSHDDKGTMIAPAALDETGKPVDFSMMAEQIRVTYANAAKILAEFGATLDNVVEETLYVLDVDEASAVAGKVRKEAYAQARPQCASNLIGVSRLAFPEQLIEIVFKAVLPTV